MPPPPPLFVSAVHVGASGKHGAFWFTLSGGFWRAAWTAAVGVGGREESNLRMHWIALKNNTGRRAVFFFPLWSLSRYVGSLSPSFAGA